MRFNHSRLDVFQRCPKKYYWTYIVNVVPKKDPVPLVVGDAVHRALAAHYMKKSTDEEKAQVAAAFDEARESKTLLGAELEDLKQQEEYVNYIMEMYHEEYPTERWTVLAPEVIGDIPLGDHYFHFRADMLISWKGHPWLFEHKTTAQLGDMFFKSFRMNGQITKYIYGVWKKLGARPIGALINAIRKSKKLDRVNFDRDVVMRSEKQLEDHMAQVHMQVEEINDMTLAMSDRPECWMMHTHECVAFNRVCDYIDLCTDYRPMLLEMFQERKPDYVDEGGENAKERA